jgi:hypothetical protein
MIHINRRTLLKASVLALLPVKQMPSYPRYVSPLVVLPEPEDISDTTAMQDYYGYQLQMLAGQTSSYQA